MKPVEVNLEVLGYRKSYDDSVILVRLTGQGPQGKLSGLFKLDSQFHINLDGDGRYSAMHGNKSFWWNVETASGISIPGLSKDIVIAEVNKWLQQNPFAKLEHDVYNAQSAVSQAQHEIKNNQYKIEQAQKRIVEVEQNLVVLNRVVEQTQKVLEDARSKSTTQN